MRPGEQDPNTSTQFGLDLTRSLGAHTDHPYGPFQIVTPGSDLQPSDLTLEQIDELVKKFAVSSGMWHGAAEIDRAQDDRSASLEGIFGAAGRIRTSDFVSDQHKTHQFGASLDLRTPGKTEVGAIIDGGDDKNALTAKTSRRDIIKNLFQPFSDDLDDSDERVQAADDQAKSVPNTVDRDAGMISRRGLVLGALGIAVAGGVAIYAINKLLNGGIHFDAPDINNPLGTSPPDVTVEAMHETIEIRGTFEMLAIADVTMGVEVNGFKEGLGIDVFGITDAEFKKDLWMRMALTTDNKQINDSLVVTKERTKDGERVLGVRATLNAADIFMPHYDLFNFLNFVSLRPGDTDEERAKKIYEFATQNGKHYDETGGFDCGACSVSSAELFNASILGAMYAVSLDGRQPDLVDRMTKRYQLNLQTQLAAQYGLPLEKVQIDIAYDEGSNPLAPPTQEQVKEIYQSRLDEIYQQYYENVTIEYQGKEQQVDIGKVVFEVKPELRYDHNNEPYAYLRLHGGAEITIKLGGITLEEDIRSMIISGIDEFEEKVIDNPNTGTTTNVATGATQSNQPVTTSTQPIVGPPFNPQSTQPTPTTEKVFGPAWPGNTSTTQG